MGGTTRPLTIHWYLPWNFYARLGLLNLSISVPSFNLFSTLAGLLDSEAHIHPSVAFKTSGCSSLCHICPDLVLGTHRRCFASDGYLLEVIKDHVFGRSHS